MSKPRPNSMKVGNQEKKNQEPARFRVMNQEAEKKIQEQEKFKVMNQVLGKKNQVLVRFREKSHLLERALSLST